MIMKKIGLIVFTVLLFCAYVGAEIIEGDLEVTRDSELGRDVHIGRNLTVDNSTYVTDNIYGLGISTTGAEPAAGGASHDFVDFDLLYDGACTEGRMQWDFDDGTPEIGMPGGAVCLQIGQELLVPRAKNVEGSTILNGQLVYIFSASGQKPTMKLASAGVHSNARATIAMATQDVLNNQFGYFTAFGNVRDIGTFGYPEGTPLFLSTTAGDYTDTLPTQPDSQVFIGVVLYEHNTEGIIFVKIVPEPNIDELSDVLAGSYVDDDFFVRDTVLGVWKNTQLDTIADAKYVRRDGTTALTAAWDAGLFDIKSTSFSIGANTLDTQEWGYLDGQDQALKTTDNVGFFQIAGATRYGLTAGNYMKMETVYDGTFIKMPMISFTGSGAATPYFGAMKNALYIAAIDTTVSELFFADDSFGGAQCRFSFDVITGVFTYYNNGTDGTIWNGYFTLTDGLLSFDGDGSGLPYGSMYNHDVSTIVTISFIGTPVRVPSGFTVGQLNFATFDNNREITVIKAGRYKVVWSVSFTSVSANQEIEGSLMVDNVFNDQCTAHRRIATATDTGAMSGTCILDLDADSAISIGILNETSTANVIIEHANMTLSMVGGS